MKNMKPIQRCFFFITMALALSLISCPVPGESGSGETASNSYTVTFDSQVATVAAIPTSKTVVPPATTIDALPTDPTKTSHIFEGWYTGTNGSGTPFDATTEVTADITVYAFWSTYTYTVTFVSLGPGGETPDVEASPTSKTVVCPATTIDSLPTPPSDEISRRLGNFLGWLDGGGTSFDETTEVTADITVYASWNGMQPGLVLRNGDRSVVQGFSAGAATFVSLAVDSADTMYVAYSDAANSNKATVQKFNVASGNWELVGNAGFSPGSADYISLVINDTIPMIAFKDGSASGKVTVMIPN